MSAFTLVFKVEVRRRSKVYQATTPAVPDLVGAASQKAVRR